MSEAKHTPGPWDAVLRKTGKRLNQPWISGDCGYVTVCSFNYEAHGDRMMRPGEEDANIRLIASAPELLEALRELNNDRCDRDCEAVSGQDIRHTPGCRKTMQLLAKAAGDKP